MLKSLCFSLCLSGALFSKEAPSHPFNPNTPGDPLLNEIALETGTDKSSKHHNYTEVYAKYFSPLREKPITFLEIGIFKGHSVKMWEDYFTSADLHFIDITDERIEYSSDRSHYHYIDQSDIPSLRKFAKTIDGGFDIIIDDGGHTMNQQINSFKALFPFVKSGGIYIIEDLHTSYSSSYGGVPWGSIKKRKRQTAIGYVLDLVHDLNYQSAKTHCADKNKSRAQLDETLNIYQKDIYSIHFYSSLCFIIKR